MIRTLILVSIVSFALAVACFAGAFGIVGGPFNIDDNGRFHKVDWREDGPGRGDGATPAGQGDMTWRGGSRLLVDAPADITYIQGDKTQLSIRGPQDLLNRVVVTDGRIGLEDGVVFGHHFNHDRLQIQLTAPGVSRFELTGDQSLRIQAYRQDRLDLDLTGSADVSAEGEARSVGLDITGSSSADLGHLAAQDAKISISGSGDATLAPRGDVAVDVSGSGDVRLLTRPRSLHSEISGSGAVTQPNA